MASPLPELTQLVHQFAELVLPFLPQFEGQALLPQKLKIFVKQFLSLKQLFIHLQLERVEQTFGLPGPVREEVWLEEDDVVRHQPGAGSRARGDAQFNEVAKLRPQILVALDRLVILVGEILVQTFGGERIGPLSVGRGDQKSGNKMRID